jgi:hypothetical protein
MKFDQKQTMLPKNNSFLLRRCPTKNAMPPISSKETNANACVPNQNAESIGQFMTKSSSGTSSSGTSIAKVGRTDYIQYS